MKEYDKLIFEISRPGRKGYELPADNYGHDALADIPAGLMRGEAAELPEVSELDVVRHYTNLSNKNFGVDTGFYPLGSCTSEVQPQNQRGGGRYARIRRNPSASGSRDRAGRA